MGYREILESYLKLSRKDLQGLCKEYKLPANRSHTELAKSLASLFKKKNVFPAHSTKKKKKINVEEVTYSAAMGGKSTVCSIGPETVNPSSGTNKDFAGECERRRKSCESEGIHLTALIKDKLLEANLENVCSYPLVERKREGGGCPTSKAKAGDKGPIVLADASDFLVDPRHIYNYDGNPVELRSSGHKLLSNSAANSETDKAVEDMINHMGTAPGNEPDNNICKRVAPSFQFFVASEEGLDLCVDLDSSPADWISRLKEEICINHKFSICGHNKSFVNADSETLKLGNSTLHVENMAAVGRNTGCSSSSSLSSAISEKRHYEVHPLDATVVNSNQPPLAMSSFEISVCLAEAPLCCDDQNCAASDSTFCHTDKNIILQEREETSLTMERSNVSVAADVSNLCDGITVLKHNDNEHAPDVGKIAYRSATCNVLNEIGQKDLSEVSGNNNQLLNICQHSKQQLLVCTLVDAQPDVGSAEKLLNSCTCASTESCLLEDQDVEEQNLVDEKPILKAPNSTAAVAEHATDQTVWMFLWIFQLRGSSEIEDRSGTTINLRCVKRAVQELTCDSITLPRQSARLITKCDPYCITETSCKINTGNIVIFFHKEEGYGLQTSSGCKLAETLI